MPAYTYLIKDEAGGRREGELKADNLDLAMKKLSAGNQIIVRLEEVDTSWDFIGPFIDEINLSIERFKNRIPLSNLVFYSPVGDYVFCRTDVGTGHSGARQ